MTKICSSFCLVLLFAAFLYAQKVHEEGRVWLERHIESAEINVTGVWNDEAWGNITLEQPQGSREITGDGDLWKIDGVVSGKKVFLLFSYIEGDVQYSAVLDYEQEDTLRGTYSGDLITADKPGDKSILMTRTSQEVVQPAVGAENETARVVVYMKKNQHEPGVYLDGRQLVWMRKGYFSFRLAPGPHEMYLKGSGFSGGGPYDDPIQLDARAGESYFFEAGRWGAFIKSWQYRAKSEATCMKDMRDMEPLEGKYVLMDSIVLLDPIPPRSGQLLTGSSRH